MREKGSKRKGQFRLALNKAFDLCCPFAFRFLGALLVCDLRPGLLILSPDSWLLLSVGRVVWSKDAPPSVWSTERLAGSADDDDGRWREMGGDVERACSLGCGLCCPAPSVSSRPGSPCTSGEGGVVV